MNILNFFKRRLKPKPISFGYGKTSTQTILPPPTVGEVNPKWYKPKQKKKLPTVDDVVGLFMKDYKTHEGKFMASDDLPGSY